MSIRIGGIYADFTLNVAGFEKNLKKVNSKLNKFGSEAGRIGGRLSRNITAPIAAIGAVSARSFIQFESAFAGVRKTVDASEKEFKKLEKGILKMSTRMPATAAQISKVAESAGQLGIQTKNILSFTEVMVSMGEATNLSAEDAAMSLARFAKITNMSQKDFERLGSTIVGLGNNFETTEKEIVEMGLRLAGAGNQVGLTQAQIMGLATALSSVGINAEAGGSAMSKALIKMQEAVSKGGKKLNLFNDVAKKSGVEFKNFAKLFKKDAAQALNVFILGLSKSKDALADLSNLGMTEVRLRDALLRLSGSAEGLGQAFKKASESWTENQALADEVSKRYATLESKLRMAKNALTLIGIEIGAKLAPLLLKLAKSVQQLSAWFTELDPKVKNMIMTFAGVAAVFGPVLLGVKTLIFTLTTLTTPIGLVAAGIAGLSALMMTYPEETKIAVDILNESWNLIANGFLALIDEVEEGLKMFVYLWENAARDIPVILKKLMHDVKYWLVTKMWEIVDLVKKPIDDVTGFFKDMWRKVVGNSYVPDMVEAVGDWFGRLGGYMVDPALAATGQVSKAFDKMATDADRSMNALGAVMKGVGNNIGGSSGNIVSQLGQLFSSGGGSGGSNPLSGLLNGGFSGGDSDLLSSLFGGSGSGSGSGGSGLFSTIMNKLKGRAPGMEGPLLEDGTFSESMFAEGTNFMEIGNGIGMGMSISSAIGAISKLGQSSEETAEGIGELAGTGLGYWLGGSMGGAIGGKIGKLGGSLSADALGLGGPSHPETLARIDAAKKLNEALEKIGGLKFFDDSGNATKLSSFSGKKFDGFSNFDAQRDLFDRFGNQKSMGFLGVGNALGAQFGIDDLPMGHLGAMMADDLNGASEGLKAVVDAFGLTAKSIEDSLVNLGKQSELTWHEVEVQLQGVNAALAPGIEGMGQYNQALENLLNTGARGQIALNKLKNIAIEAQEEGVGSLEALEAKMRASGEHAAKDVDALFTALRQRGVTSVDEILSLSDRVLGGVIADMVSLGAAFTDTLKQISSVTNAMSGGGSVQAFARGGVVSGATFFKHSGGLGVAGEAGPEAIMPLTRIGGKLGVRTSESGRGNVTIHVDARGAAPGVSTEILNALQAVEQRAINGAVNAVIDASNRGRI